MQGFPCRVPTTLVLLILRRISNHSPNSSSLFTPRYARGIIAPACFSSTTRSWSNLSGTCPLTGSDRFSLKGGMQPLLLVALSLRYAWASEPWRFFTATTRSWSNLSGTCPLTGSGNGARQGADSPDERGWDGASFLASGAIFL